MRMLLDTDHADGLDQFDTVIYDRAAGVGDNSALYAVVASSYIAAFATDVGATLKDATGTAITLQDALLIRPDGSEIKQLEAFFAYIHAAPGGALPSQYDTTSPTAAERFVCVNGC